MPLIPRFTYRYKGKIIESFAEQYGDKKHARYIVNLNKGHVIIERSKATGQLTDNVWVQYPKPNQSKQPDDLIQALGEGMDAA